MDEKLKKLEAKLDKLDNRLDNIDKTLVRQHESLEYHIRRTNLLEESVSKIREEARPVQDHVKFIQGLGKLFVSILAAAGAIAGIAKIFLG